MPIEAKAKLNKTCLKVKKTTSKTEIIVKYKLNKIL